MPTQWRPVQYQPVAEPLAVPLPVGSGAVGTTGAVIVARTFVQYQPVAAPVFVPSPGISWMPGFPVVFGQDIIQYQALAAPVYVIAAPVLPPGIGAWLPSFPAMVPGPRPLSTGAQPHYFFNSLPRTSIMTAAALSWVPAYSGPPRLETALQRSYSLQTFVVPPPVTPLRAWTPVYPDMVGQQRPGLQPSAMPSLFRQTQPIAPPVPALSWAPQYPTVLLPRPQPSSHVELVEPSPEALIVPHGAPRVKILSPRRYIKVAPELDPKLLSPRPRSIIE